MVASGTHVNSGCCFDFGNAETNNRRQRRRRTWTRSTSAPRAAGPRRARGSGPWVEADMENGLYLGGDGSNPTNTGNSSHFVTAVLEEQRPDDLRAQGRQRPVRRPVDLTRTARCPSGYAPMQPGGRDRARHRRRQQQRLDRLVLRGRDDLRLPDRRRRQRRAGQHRRRRTTPATAAAARRPPAARSPAPAASASTSSAMTPAATARWWTCGTASPTPSTSTGPTTPTTR